MAAVRVEQVIAGIWRAPVRQHVPKAAFGDVFLHHSFRDIGKPASRERPVQQLGRAPKIEQRLRQLIRRIELTDAGGWYDGEIRETWPAFTTTRYLAPRAAGSGTREDRDRLLAEAEVILGGWPFPLDLRARHRG